MNNFAKKTSEPLKLFDKTYRSKEVELALAAPTDQK